ncbi:MAG TPA: hypothetical protein VL049_13005 [Candidatus Dormibacteraeota bacterium]|nr:hypothetical protein [Candidatus Dormibacteraeota bacterium]
MNWLEQLAESSIVSQMAIPAACPLLGAPAAKRMPPDLDRRPVEGLDELLQVFGLRVCLFGVPSSRADAEPNRTQRRADPYHPSSLRNAK